MAGHQLPHSWMCVARKAQASHLMGRQVADFCRGNGVELVVIGPEAPLVAGLADSLSAAGIE